MTITLNKVTKSYGANTVFDALSLTLDDNSPYALIGSSGIGKTTLFRLIAGLEKPNAGSIRVENARISYAFQEPRLFPQLCVRENLSVFSPERDIDEILARLDLSDAAEKYPHELSGGMKKRVELARALAQKADIYLLDEPTGGQDSAHAAAVADAIGAYTAGASVLIATHDAELQNRLCSRTIIVENGRCTIT